MISLFYLVWLSVVSFWVIVLANSFLKQKRRVFLFNRYNTLKKIIDECKDISFNKVYREHLLTNISSGYRINNKDVLEIGQTYVKLVLDCLGPNNVSDLISIFGDLDSICLILMHGFITKVLEIEKDLLVNAANGLEEDDNAINLLLNK